MRAESANFGFLKGHGEQLFRLAALAEHYFRADPNTCLFKLRQFAELLAQDVAARAGLLPQQGEAFSGLLGSLGRSGAVPARALDLFHWLRRHGNEAAHEGRDDFASALTGLKVARELGGWFVRSYAGEPGLKLGAFAPPPAPADSTAELRAELERLKAEANASRTAADLIALEDLRQSIPDEVFGKAGRPSPMRFAAAMRAAGAVGVERVALGAVPHGVIRPAGDLQQARLYAVRNHERYLSADRAELAQLYWAERLRAQGGPVDVNRLFAA